MQTMQNTLTVRVGAGTRAHVFLPRPGSESSHRSLQRGEVAYDYALCGASGELSVGERDEMVPCKTCEAILERS